MSAVTRFVRLEVAGAARFARVESDRLLLLDAAPWLAGKETGESAPLAGAVLLAPCLPSKILGIGRNYREHAREMGGDVPKEPLLFLKPPSSVAAPGAVVELPPESARVDYEGELGVVIGRRARRVSEAQALDFVLGYTVVCDVTARDLQKSDGQWSRAKGFDGFCPFGPEIVCGLDAGALELATRVNGVVKQHGKTSDMIFGVARLVSHLSQAMTLEPGDLISTGTPEGIGPLADGDHVEVEIESIGVLSFSVRAAR